jgi:hypothetical protein
MHNYESVVGPVKGVYNQSIGVNKPRGHSLLVAERPNFVTILALGESYQHKSSAAPVFLCSQFIFNVLFKVVSSHEQKYLCDSIYVIIPVFFFVLFCFVNWNGSVVKVSDCRLGNRLSSQQGRDYSLCHHNRTHCGMHLPPFFLQDKAAPC